MEATASVLPSDHQRRLQTRLEQNRQQFMIAFDLAQEMMVRGSHKIISDPVYQRRYGEPLLSMAFCLVQMAELHLEQAREPLDPLLIQPSDSLSAPLASGRAPGGGMEEHEYRALRRLAGS
jgi:hypothetical protein